MEKVVELVAVVLGQHFDFGHNINIVGYNGPSLLHSANSSKYEKTDVR